MQTNLQTILITCALWAICASCGPESIGYGEIHLKNGMYYYEDELMDGEYTVRRYNGAAHCGEWVFENGVIIEFGEIDGQSIIAKGYVRELTNPNTRIFSRVTLDSCFEGSLPPAFYSFKFILRDSSFVQAAHDSLGMYMQELRRTEKFDRNLLILDSIIAMGDLEGGL